MGDWADEKAREWLDGPGGDACVASDQSKVVPLLAALLREVREQSHSETLVRCCVHRDEKAPYIEGCDCVICHRQRVLAEVRRVVEAVDTEVTHSCNVPFCEECNNYTSGHHRAIDEILSRLEKL